MLLNLYKYIRVITRNKIEREEKEQNLYYRELCNKEETTVQREKNKLSCASKIIYKINMIEIDFVLFFLYIVGCGFLLLASSDKVNKALVSPQSIKASQVIFFLFFIKCLDK